MTSSRRSYDYDSWFEADSDTESSVDNVIKESVFKVKFDPDYSVDSDFTSIKTIIVFMNFSSHVKFVDYIKDVMKVKRLCKIDNVLHDTNLAKLYISTAGDTIIVKMRDEVSEATSWDQYSCLKTFISDAAVVIVFDIFKESMSSVYHTLSTSKRPDLMYLSSKNFQEECDSHNISRLSIGLVVSGTAAATVIAFDMENRDYIVFLVSENCDISISPLSKTLPILSHILGTALPKADSIFTSFSGNDLLYT